MKILIIYMYPILFFCFFIVCQNALQAQTFPPPRPVYPGNTTAGYGLLGNDPGVSDPVNMEDLLVIGLNYGKQGARRIDSQLDFSEKIATPWHMTITGPYGIVNGKHADANGDGLVNMKDTTIIAQNYGQVYQWDCSQEKYDELLGKLRNTCELNSNCIPNLSSFDYRGHTIYKIENAGTQDCFNNMYIDCNGNAIAPERDQSFITQGDIGNIIPALPQGIKDTFSSEELLWSCENQGCFFDDLATALATLGLPPCAGVLQRGSSFLIKYQIDQEGIYAIYNCAGDFVCEFYEDSPQICSFTPTYFIGGYTSSFVEFDAATILQEENTMACNDCIFDNIPHALSTLGYSACASVVEHPFWVNGERVFQIQHEVDSDGPDEFYTCQGTYICGLSESSELICTDQIPPLGTPLQVLQEENVSACSTCYFEENHEWIISNFFAENGVLPVEFYGRINKRLYNGEEVFYVSKCISYADDYAQQYIFNCDGSLLCEFQSFIGEEGDLCNDFLETSTEIQLIYDYPCECVFTGAIDICATLEDLGFNPYAGVTQYDYRGEKIYFVYHDSEFNGSAYYYNCQGMYICGSGAFKPPTTCPFDVEQLSNPVIIKEENSEECLDQQPSTLGKTAQSSLPDIQLRVEASNIIVLPNGQQLYDFALYLEGTEGQAVDALYGLAFSIDYSSPLPTDANVVFEDIDGSSICYLGDINSDNRDEQILAMRKNIQEEEGGVLEVGITRINQEGINGTGQLCRIICIATIDDWGVGSPLGKTSVNAELELSVSDIYLLRSDGIKQPVIPAPPTIIELEPIGIEKLVKLKAFLEGPFNENTGFMDLELMQQALIPNVQPYNQAPWLYNGKETINNFPLADQVVDWVLVELRDPENETELLAIRAGLLLADGRVVSPNDIEGIPFTGLAENQSYKVIVRHRSHLAVYSSEVMQESNNELSYDFTTGITQAAGEQQLHLANTPSGNMATLHAGDLNGDGYLTVSDFNHYLQDAATINQYAPADCNMDRAVTVKDFNLYLNNSSLIGVDIIRY